MSQENLPEKQPAPQPEPGEPQPEKREPLPTIWEVTEAMWENLFLPLLTELDPPNKMGRPRADQRKCLDGMIYRARTGCQWNKLPERFGSDSTVHRTVYRWDSKGVFDRLWALLIYHSEELQAVHWEWQAADGCLLKARFIGGQKGGAKRASQKSQGQKSQGQKSQGQKSQGQKSQGQESQGGRRVKASAPARPTVARWASSRACWSREAAARFLSASPART